MTSSERLRIPASRRSFSRKVTCYTYGPSELRLQGNTRSPQFAIISLSRLNYPRPRRALKRCTLVPFHHSFPNRPKKITFHSLLLLLFCLLCFVLGRGSHSFLSFFLSFIVIGPFMLYNGRYLVSFN